MQVYSKVYGQVIATFDDYIFKNSIEMDKQWEEHNCSVISSHMKPGTDFIDIGANIGLVTLGVKNVTGNIHCFECNTETFNFLKHNTSTRDNVILYNFGLSDKHTLGTMAVNEYNQGCNHFDSTLDETFEYEHTKNNKNLKKNNKLFFSLVPLDFMKDTFTNKISVIKIDVEGMEYHVLKGAKEIILKHKPALLVEIFAVNKKKVHDLLQEYGYTRVEYLGNEDYLFTHLNKNVTDF
jgi:FkbM family methyltransferase